MNCFLITPLTAKAFVKDPTPPPLYNGTFHPERQRQRNFFSLLYRSNILNEKSVLMEQLRNFPFQGYKPRDRWKKKWDYVFHFLMPQKAVREH